METKNQPRTEDKSDRVIFGHSQRVTDRNGEAYPMR